MPTPVEDHLVAARLAQQGEAVYQHSQVQQERRKFSLIFRDCLCMMAQHLNRQKNNLLKLVAFGEKFAKCM
jgi:hypothetical protein